MSKNTITNPDKIQPGDHLLTVFNWKIHCDFKVLKGTILENIWERSQSL